MFIDSDIQKQKNNGALEPEKIDGSKMYIIIFLEHHQDIADMLSLHGLKENENFIYPKNADNLLFPHEPLQNYS